MNENLQVTVLLEEYKSLSSAIEKHILLPYKAIPVWATIIAVLTVFGKADGISLGGVIFEYGIAVLVIGFAFAHAMTNGIGLRLVAIEQRINSRIGLHNDTGLGWTSYSLGSAGKPFPGYQFYVFVTTLLGVFAAIVAGIVGWLSLTNQLKVDAWISTIIILAPIFVAILCLGRMCFAESHANMAKKRLIENMKREATQPGSSR